MSAANSAAQALKKAAAHWPQDVLRPQLQFKELLRYIADATPEKVTPQTVAAVRELQKDTLMQKYPLLPKTTSPASMPQHYNHLLIGFENAKLGKRRPFWKVLFGIYK